MTTDVGRCSPGLPNRHGFLAAIRTNAAGAVHVGGLDHFFYFNNKVGHGAGDQLLCRFAGFLAEPVHLGSLATHSGGDILAVYLPDTAAFASAQRTQSVLEHKLAPDRDLARQLLDPRCFAVPPATRFWTMSFGVAKLHQSGGTAEALAAAKTACISAKHSGRNRVAAVP